MTKRSAGISKSGIEHMQREIQQEIDKHPIRVTITADLPDLPGIRSGPVSIYHGPVIMGNADGSQFAWDNQNVNQSQCDQPRQAADGYAELAQVVKVILRNLPALGLEDDDHSVAAEAGQQILTQVTERDPDPGKIKQAVITLRGCLTSAAFAAQTGADQGVANWAKTAIEHLLKIRLNI